MPADKGNALVVIDCDEYNEKCNEHLSNEDTYRKLDNNPILSMKGKVNRLLQKYKREGIITEEEYKHLYVNTAITPLFYALIKTHKPGFPIRPIVSFIDSPTYRLAQFLSKILIPITDLSDKKLKNSLHAKEILQDINVPQGYNLVSFDVKSLFTSIPIPFALQCVEEKLEDDNLPDELKKLPNHAFMTLLRICTSSNTFQWN